MASATIYKIRDRISGMCYIGCTTLPIDVRIYQHTMASNNCTSHAIMEAKAYEVEVLEKCALSNRFERESYYINEFRDYVVNKIGVKVIRDPRESRLDSRKQHSKTNIKADTPAEYHHKYKTEIRKKETTEYNQDYYDRHKERLTSKVDCGCGGRYCLLTKSQHEKCKKHIRFEMEQLGTV